MEWKEALPLLQENHTGVAISVTPKGRAQATVVSTAVLDGKVGFGSRGYTVKVKNIERTGRARHRHQARHPALRHRRGSCDRRALARHERAYQAPEGTLRCNGPGSQGYG